jgi:hypothetical protein
VTAPAYAAVVAELLTAIDPADDHAEAELLDLLNQWSVHVPDENDFVFVPAGRTPLVAALIAWRNGGVR